MLKRQLSRRLSIFFIAFLTILLLVGTAWATNWYVRPKGVGLSTKDGTSWATAWEGLDTVVWGGTGVSAGDTLWVCGDMRQYGTVSLTNVILTAGISGTSSSRITIRGDVANAPDVNAQADHPSDYNTALIGSFYRVYPVGTTWALADAVHHVYSLSTASIVEPLIDVTNNLIYQQCQPNGTTPPSDYSVFTSGSFYWDATHTILYVRTHGDVNPGTLRIYTMLGGNSVDLTGCSYIDVKNLTIYGGIKLKSSTHNLIDSNSIQYATTGISLGQSSDYNTLNNNQISICCDGIYFHWFMDSYTGTPGSNNVVSSCTIHNIRNGMDRPGSSSDNEIIGVQSGLNNAFSGNTLYDGKVGISLYSGYGEDMSFTANNNFIHDCFRTTTGDINPNSGFGNGILFQSSKGFSGTLTANLDENIFANTQNAAIAIGWPGGSGTGHVISYYNNTVYHCQIGYFFGGANAKTHSYNIKNTIVSTPYDYGSGLPVVMAYYQDYLGARQDSTVDYNCYYPGSTGRPFYYAGGYTGTPVDWSAWKTVVHGDTHSTTSNPHFANAGGSYALTTDFKLTAASSFAVKSGGTSGGPSTDFGGRINALGYNMGAWGFTSRR